MSKPKTDYVVIDHHLDKDQGFYRIAIGIPYEVQVQETSSDGTPQHEQDRPKMIDVPMADGTVEQRPLLGPDGEPLLTDGSPKMKTETRYDSVEDFVFAADDEKWEGMAPSEVAEEQRKAVVAQIRKRAKDAEKAEADRVAARSNLPGAGDAL